MVKFSSTLASFGLHKHTFYHVNYFFFTIKLYANLANCLNLLTVFIIIVSVNNLSIKHEKAPLQKHIPSFNNLGACGGSVQKALYII